ncbi:sugar ABC transporter permease [Alicyclobacillus cellulosilyticus]|uniref:Sugar ABC transporter permease n=2 Tax=Alicyclobacillus cellulosilyticus TaxID=1003997 RepID=A0A917K5Q7_9BACL|nr:sugar ABC transporter permease [Alicyclobacillus cellulosilyticus]
MAAYAFMLPWLVGFFGLAVGPMAASLYLSLTDYSLLAPPHFIGVANYVRIFTQDPSFYQSLRVTTLYVLLSVPCRLLFALAVAMALDQGIRAVGLYRTIYYIPSLMGGSVAVALVWKKVFGYDGVFNHFLSLFGWQGMDWVANPKTVLYTIVGLSVWQFGSAMLIFLAGLKQIPAELYEAASVDGASRVRRFVSITLPLLTPTILFNLVMGIISSFQNFTSGYIIGDGRGGPLQSTLFYTLNLYLQGFSYFHMGYAAALAWVMLIILALLTWLLFATQRYWVFYFDGQEKG